MPSQDDNDNVYMDLSVAKQIVDDLFEKDREVKPDQCLCGSKKFTVENDETICSACGAALDPEVGKSPPISCP